MHGPALADNWMVRTTDLANTQSACCQNPASLRQARRPHVPTCMFALFRIKNPETIQACRVWRRKKATSTSGPRATDQANTPSSVALQDEGPVHIAAPPDCCNSEPGTQEVLCKSFWPCYDPPFDGRWVKAGKRLRSTIRPWHEVHVDEALAQRVANTDRVQCVKRGVGALLRLCAMHPSEHTTRAQSA